MRAQSKRVTVRKKRTIEDIRSVHEDICHQLKQLGINGMSVDIWTTFTNKPEYQLYEQLIKINRTTLQQVQKDKKILKAALKTQEDLVDKKISNNSFEVGTIRGIYVSEKGVIKIFWIKDNGQKGPPMTTDLFRILEEEE